MARTLSILMKVILFSTFCLFAVPVVAQEQVRSLEHLKELQSNIQKVAKQHMKTTVCVLSPDGASGSGVVVSQDGIILTAAHVVRKSDEVEIVYSDGKSAKAKVLGANFSKDAAMLQLKSKQAKHFAKIADVKKLKVGDWMVAMGHSAGYDPVRTPPVRFGRFLRKQRTDFITTDCTLVGGDSGGPLFNIEGELVAIHSNIGASLSLNNHTLATSFQADWERLKKGERWGSLNLNPLNDPDRPVIGIDMGYRNGRILVNRVYDKSPAHLAGIKAGDVITKLNNSEIKSPEVFIGKLMKFDAGDTVKIEVLRAGKNIQYDLVLGRLEELKQNR